MFNTNCEPNNSMPFSSTPLLAAFQNKYNEKPIITYKIVQTGPKMALGGLKEGLFRFAYQVGISDTVDTEPISPATNGRSKDVASFIVTVKYSAKRPIKTITWFFKLYLSG